MQPKNGKIGPKTGYAAHTAHVRYRLEKKLSGKTTYGTDKQINVLGFGKHMVVFAL